MLAPFPPIGGAKNNTITATADATKRRERNSAAKEKEAAAAKEAAKRQKAKDKETTAQAAKAKEEAARKAREAEAARRAEQSPAAKRKATEAKEAAAAQEDAKLKAPEAEAEAIANATQEANDPALAQQAEAQPTPSKKPKKIRDGPHPPRFPAAGISKEDAGWAHWSGWFDMGEGPSDSDDSTEKKHQEECRRAAAERTRRNEKGLAMKDEVHVLVDAEARAKFLGEVEVSDIDPRPEDTEVSVTVTGYSEPSCWRGPLPVSTSSMSFHGSSASQTLSDRRTFPA